MSRIQRNLRIKDDNLARVLAGEAYLVEDGGMGTMVQSRGLSNPGDNPDLLSLTQAEGICGIQRDYVAAGAQMVTTNTFGANRLNLAGEAEVAEVYRAAADIARAAGARYVAADIGPTGRLLKPLGTLSFEDAYDLFSEQARAAQAAGCDLVVVETMADLLEAKAAVLAAVENTDLPVFATMTFGENGRTLLGTTPAVAATVLSALGASAVGVNCSLGPADLAPIVREIAEHAGCPVIVKPNAGLPRVEGGETVYDVAPDEFASAFEGLLEAGACVVGGCCGTTPAHIERLSELVAHRVPVLAPAKTASAVSSVKSLLEVPANAAALELGTLSETVEDADAMASVAEGDFDDVVDEALDIAADEVQAIVVPAALLETALDNVADLVGELQGAVAVPLAFEVESREKVEAAVRAYAGVPLLVVAKGAPAAKADARDLADKYGCVVVSAGDAE